MNQYKSDNENLVKQLFQVRSDYLLGLKERQQQSVAAEGLKAQLETTELQLRSSRDEAVVYKQQVN